MRLAIVIPGFQANSADWCIPAFTNLARELAKHVDVHVFTLRYPSARKTYRVGRVHVHALGGGAFQGRRVFGFSLVSLWRDTLRSISKSHKKEPFSAILGIWATESGWLATVAARRLGLPSIVHLAGGELVWLSDIRYGTRPKSLPAAMVKSSIRNATLVTVPSSTIVNALLESGLRGSVPRAIWSLGVDTEMFAPIPQSQINGRKRPFTFICVGSLLSVKGHEHLLQAFALMLRGESEAAVRLQIIGAGPLDIELRRLCVTLGLKGYVDFIGEVVHDELPQYYRAADCFVIASRHEAQCMAALEAMACGLPWVGPRVGALADVPSNTAPDQTGICVNTRDRQEFATALRNIMRLPPDTLYRWGQNAIEVVMRDYSLSKQTKQLVDFVAQQVDTRA